MTICSRIEGESWEKATRYIRNGEMGANIDITHVEGGIARGCGFYEPHSRCLFQPVQIVQYC